MFFSYCNGLFGDHILGYLTYLSVHTQQIPDSERKKLGLGPKGQGKMNKPKQLPCHRSWSLVQRGCSYGHANHEADSCREGGEQENASESGTTRAEE